MKVYEVQTGSTGLDGLRRAERPQPKPGPQQVLIRIHAASLNYRDHMVVMGRYFTAVDRDTIPLSDGAGEVVDLGPGVTRFKTGDRVCGTFVQVWKDGPRPAQGQALGVPADGTLAEYIALHEDGVVAMPRNLSFEEAAALPCAGVTAWNALMVAGRSVKPGDTVVCLGTGGVSMMAVQFAKAAGALVIVTSSSDEKVQRAYKIGATHGINYKTHPEWDKEVERLTEGRGADHIVEIGGAGSLPYSYRAVGFGGKIALIGFLAGAGDPNPMPLMMKAGSLHGIGVGSTRMFEDMNRAIEANGIQPPVDKIFPFDAAADAFRCLASRDFVGKIVIKIA
ncbi:MAG: NAD(P)-dependent alcohol dehydrogenase [Bryobacterales bacterium]|nr:NAD(P)-dependent alcohol dehydrogenase [Bryobacterales bacterium]MBV9396736.1 NAD(P)-dependent alcohol dehydrogenase [Bryobacterales bacterium]